MPRCRKRVSYSRVALMSAIRMRPPGRSTRTASSTALARPTASGMLWIARLLSTRSNDLSPNGNARMSPVCVSANEPGPESEPLADDCGIAMPAGLSPGCDAAVWLSRHHKADATIASTIVVLTATQNQRR